MNIFKFVQRESSKHFFLGFSVRIAQNLNAKIRQIRFQIKEITDQRHSTKIEQLETKIDELSQRVR